MNGNGRAEGRSAAAEVVLMVARAAAEAEGAGVLLAEASWYAACVGEVAEVAAMPVLPCAQEIKARSAS
jgi:hypothetical protein